MSGNMQPYVTYITPQSSPQLTCYSNAPAEVVYNAQMPPCMPPPGAFLIDVTAGGAESNERSAANQASLQTMACMNNNNNSNNSAAGKAAVFTTAYNALPCNAALSSAASNILLTTTGSSCCTAGENNNNNNNGSNIRERNACTPAVYAGQTQGPNNVNNNNSSGANAYGPTPVGNVWCSGHSEPYNTNNHNSNAYNLYSYGYGHGACRASRSGSPGFATNPLTTRPGCAAEWSASTPDMSGPRGYSLYAASPSTPSGTSATEYVPTLGSAGSYVEAPVDLRLYRAGPTQSSHLSLTTSAAQGVGPTQRGTPSSLASPASHYEMAYRTPLRRPTQDGLLSSPGVVAPATHLHRLVSAPSSSSLATASQTRVTPHSVSSSLSAVSGRWPLEEAGRATTQVPMGGNAAALLCSALPLPGMTSYYPLTALPMPPPQLVPMQQQQQQQYLPGMPPASTQDQSSGRIMSVRSFMAPQPVGCVDIPNNALIPTVPGLALPRPPQGRLPPEPVTASE